MVGKVDVPVAIGGGVCDGRGLVGVLAMGGEAGYMGTRFCSVWSAEESMRSNR